MTPQQLTLIGNVKMKFVWFLLLSVLRTLYVFYSAWCLLFIPAVIAFFYAEHHNRLPQFWQTYQLNQIGLIVTAILLIAIPLIVFARRSKDDPDPFQSGFMSWFGTLRWYWNTSASPKVQLGLPSGYLVENPMGCRLNGDEIFCCVLTMVTWTGNSLNIRRWFRPKVIKRDGSRMRRCSPVR